MDDPAHQWGKTKVSTTPLNVLINFRVPTATRKLLREYAEHHDINVSWLLRYNLEQILKNIDLDGLPPELEQRIERHHLNKEIDAHVQYVKTLRYMAYRKAEAIAWLKRGVSVRTGLDQDASDPKFNILNGFTDALLCEHNLTQRQIITLCAEYEKTFENQEEIQTEKTTE